MLDVTGLVGKTIVEFSVGYGYEGSGDVETGLVGKGIDVFLVGCGKGVQDSMLGVTGLVGNTVDEVSVG